MSVDIDDRPRLVALTAPAPKSPPHLVLHLVHRAAQPGQLVLLLMEATQEVTARRWIRDPRCADDPPHRFAVLQIGDVFDAGAADVQVERLGQHVIGLVVRHVDEEDLDVSVDALGDLEPTQERGRDRDATVRRHLRPFIHFHVGAW